MRVNEPLPEKEFYVMNRITKETHESVKAPSAQEACERCGWMIGDCHVREVITLHRGHIVV